MIYIFACIVFFLDVKYCFSIQLMPYETVYFVFRLSQANQY